MTRFLHPLFDVKNDHIGQNIKIKQFVVVLPDAQIRVDCNICSYYLLANGMIVGGRVTLKCGAQLGDCIRIEDDVFIRPSVKFANDPFSLCKHYPESFPLTIVKTSASTGGGNAASRDDDLAIRHGGRRRGDDPVGARWRCGSEHPGADRAFCEQRQ